MADIQVFVAIEESMTRLLTSTLLPVAGEQLQGVGNNPGAASRALDGLNFGPAVDSIRKPLELLAANAILLGAAQFTEGKEVRLTHFVRDLEIPPEVSAGVQLLVQQIDGSANDRVREEGQRVLQEAEEKEESAPITSTSAPISLFKQFEGLAGKLNRAVATGTRLQSSVAANLTTSRMVTFGALSQATAGGIKTYQWNAQLDGKTCPFCTGMHGKVFSVGPNLAVISSIIRSADPEAARALSPWPKQTIANLNRLAGLSNAKLQEERFSLPPAHPRCRCVASIVGSVSRAEIIGFLRFKPGQGSMREQLARHMGKAKVKPGQAPAVDPEDVAEGLSIPTPPPGTPSAILEALEDEEV